MTKADSLLEKTSLVKNVEKEIPQSPAETVGKEDAQQSKPFPWPLPLALVILITLVGIGLWGWYLNDYILLMRIGWVLLCSVIPGLFLMMIIGSISQIRSRPVLSSISLVFGIVCLSACLWTIQKIVQNAEAFLK